MKKFSKSLNEMIFEWLWGKSFAKRVVYFLIPWFLIGISFLIIYFRNAWYLENGYGFLNDGTNKGVLTYMFILLYYVSGYYPSYIKTKVDLCIDKIKLQNDKMECQSAIIAKDKYIPWINLLSIALAIAGLWFVLIANRNGVRNWYCLLTTPQLIYYAFLVSLSWYMSASVLLRTLLAGVKIYTISRYKMEVNVYHHNGTNLTDVFSLLLANIGLAMYYVLSVVIIIVSDFKAVNFNVENTFYKYPILIFPIILVLMVYLAFTIIPFIEYRRIVIHAIDKELQNENINEEKVNKLKKVRNSMFYPQNIEKIVFVWVFPVVHLIISISQLFLQI